MKGELGIVAAGEPLRLRWRLIRQLLQDFLAQLLRLSKKPLVFEKQPVQLQRSVGREALAQNHVADAHWIGKDGVFAEFFQGSSGIIVVHGSNCSPVPPNASVITSRFSSEGCTLCATRKAGPSGIKSLRNDIQNPHSVGLMSAAIWPVQLLRRSVAILRFYWSTFQSAGCGR